MRIVSVSKTRRDSVGIVALITVVVQLGFCASLCPPFASVGGDHRSNSNDEQCRQGQRWRERHDDVAEACHHGTNGFTSGNGMVSRIP